jgi:hypothetical protein
MNPWNVYEGLAGFLINSIRLIVVLLFASR